MGYPYPVLDDNAIVTPEKEALTPDLKDKLRSKVVVAVDMALEVVIKAMQGEARIKPIQLMAARLVMPYCPKIEHGAAPVTLVLPGIPRPQSIKVDAVTVEATPAPEKQENQP